MRAEEKVCDVGTKPDLIPFMDSDYKPVRRAKPWCEATQPPLSTIEEGESRRPKMLGEKGEGVDEAEWEGEDEP